MVRKAKNLSIHLLNDTFYLDILVIFLLFSNKGKNSGLWKPAGDKRECGKSISGTLVVGGRDAKIGEFPWMALLGYDPSTISGSEIFYLCGGSVINKHYVLTAAHCINTKNGLPV